MASDQLPPGPAPRFPIYLLPSFNLPFPRPRQRSNSPTSYGSSPPPVEHVPSLSSSPDAASTLSGSPADHSPPPPSYFASSRLSFSSFSKDVRGWASPSSSSSSSSSTITAATSLSGAGSSAQQPPLDRRRASRLARTQPDTIRCLTCSTDLAFTSQIVSKGFTGRYGRAYLVSAPPPPPASFPTTNSNSNEKDNNNNNNSNNNKRDKSTTAGDLVNIIVGRPETRLLVTGSHVVADIMCATCHAKLGWKYVDAKEEAQRYKVGKFILETQRVVDHRAWEHVVGGGNDEEDDDDDNDDGCDHVFDAKGGMRGEKKKKKKKKKQLDDTAAEKTTDPDAIVFDSGDEDECEDIFAGTWDPEVVAKRRSRKVNRRATQD